MQFDIIHEPGDGRGRYRLVADGDDGAGELDYRVVDGVRVYTHTGVRDRYEGQGLAAKLVERALTDARAEGHRLVAQCPYVRGYLARHPDEVDLVDLELTRRLGVPEPG